MGRGQCEGENRREISCEFVVDALKTKRRGQSWGCTHCVGPHFTNCGVSCSDSTVENHCWPLSSSILICILTRATSFWGKKDISFISKLYLRYEKKNPRALTCDRLCSVLFIYSYTGNNIYFNKWYVWPTFFPWAICAVNKKNNDGQYAELKNTWNALRLVYTSA